MEVSPGKGKIERFCGRLRIPCTHNTHTNLSALPTLKSQTHYSLRGINEQIPGKKWIYTLQAKQPIYPKPIHVRIGITQVAHTAHQVIHPSTPSILQMAGLPSQRFTFVGSTLSVVDSHDEPQINRWCELISIRLYDSQGVDVSAAAKVSWAQRPAGNQDPSALTNRRTWPSQPFAVWDTENGDMHNGMRLVEIIFPTPVDITRAVVLTTNTER